MRFLISTLLVSFALAMPGAVSLVAQDKAGSAPAVQDTPLPLEMVRAFPQLRPRRPVVLLNANDGTNRFFAASQQGVIQYWPNKDDVGPEDVKVFLDIENDVVYTDKENEEGFLGLAFHPKFKQNGEFFVHYTKKKDAAPHTSVVSRFRVSQDDPLKGDPRSGEELLRIPQPYWNHNGGALAFGPDGLLYIAVGDGGFKNDPHNNGQNLDTLLGKVLRIDVDRREAGRGYAIPKDNPLVGKEKTRPEIFAYGFRNPWGMTFDSATGSLWLADVGQDIWEEIDIVTRGGNYGWKLREGMHKFENGADPRPDLIEPVWEYHHNVGKSITGGYVYRGRKFPELAGCYLYADYVSGKIWALKYDAEKKSVIANYSIKDRQMPIVAFGVDQQHEIYFSDAFGQIWTIGRQAKTATAPTKTSGANTTGASSTSGYKDLPDVPGLEKDLKLRGGIANCRWRFETEKTGLVAYVGGSITAMNGWSQLVDAELQRRFPETTFNFVHAGISSIDSSGHAFRIMSDVLQKGPPDLLFVEAAVNDLHNGRNADERRRAMEGIVRRVRRANPLADIVFLHFAEPRHTADYDDGKTPEVIASHEAVAEHYRVPSLNLASEVWRRMAAGQFEWVKDFRNLHPSPFGHQVYAQGIRRVFDNGWSAVARLRVADGPKEHALPEPLDPNCYDAGVFVPIDRATNLSGFAIEKAWKPTTKSGTRPGFVDVPMLVGEKVGSSFSVKFDGRGFGLFMTAGPDTAVIEHRVDNGPWKQRETFTQWSGGLHLPWVLMLEAELAPGPHQIDVRIADRATTKIANAPPEAAKATGTALRIRQLLVNGSVPKLPPLTEIRVPSSLDGTLQPSLVWAPETAATQPTPVLVYLHSWSGTYKQDNSAWHDQAVKRGWIFLHPNFRGVNNQPQACGSKFARQDIVDSLDHVLAKYKVDRQRIYLAGSSGGGHMSLLTAAYFPQRFSAVSSWVPISDVAEWFRFHSPDGKSDRYAQMILQSLTGPPGASSAIDADYQSRSPLFHLQHAAGLPIEIAAGVQDGHKGSVPIAHTLKAFNVLAKVNGGEPVTDAEMTELWEKKELAAPRPSDLQPDESFARKIILRRTAGPSRVTIFDGGHEGLPAAACEWLERQQRATK